MLMDEPFGSLDPITRADVVRKFTDIRSKLELTVIMVTHDMAEALLLADRIAVMRKGVVLAIGKPSELLTNPDNAYVEKLLSMPQQQARMLTSITKPGGDK